MSKWSATILIIPITLFHIGCLSRASQGDTSNQKSVEQLSLSLSETVNALRQIRVEKFDSKIPPAAIPLLKKLKHHLRDLISQTLNAQNSQRVVASDVEAIILERLKEQGIEFEEPHEALVEAYWNTGYTYGDIYNITVEQPARHPDLIAATTTLGIFCGEDTSFYIFRNNGQQWELILAQEVNDYEHVYEVHGYFKYGISPPDDRNDFFVATANTTLWCVSSWKRLRYRVMRLGQSAYEPQILLIDERTIYLGGSLDNEESYELKVRRKGFDLRFLGEKYQDSITGDIYLDPDDPKSLDVVIYNIDGDQAIPVLKRGAG